LCAAVEDRALHPLSGIATVERWLSGLKAFWQQRLDALDTEIARGKRERRSR
jgi:hypothetical protein